MKEEAFLWSVKKRYILDIHYHLLHAILYATLDFISINVKYIFYDNKNLLYGSSKNR